MHFKKYKPFSKFLSWGELLSKEFVPEEELSTKRLVALGLIWGVVTVQTDTDISLTVLSYDRESPGRYQINHQTEIYETTYFVPFLSAVLICQLTLMILSSIFAQKRMARDEEGLQVFTAW